MGDEISKTDDREWALVKPEEILPAGLRFEARGDSAAIIDDGGQRVAAVRAQIQEDDDGEDEVVVEYELRHGFVVSMFRLETETQRKRRLEREAVARSAWEASRYEEARKTVEAYEAKHGRPTA